MTETSPPQEERPSDRAINRSRNQRPVDPRHFLLMQNRAIGIVAFALGIAALLVGFFLSIIAMIMDSETMSVVFVLLGFFAFSWGMYYRFVGFKKRYRKTYGSDPRMLTTMDRPDIILSPMFMLAGDDLIRDDFGKWAAAVGIIVTGIFVVLGYWFLSMILS
ncbi:MAG: hypothetical protein IH630_09295 [Thermoplasmata archaeon]|nr:hypothetical protein [Thermoplasmata archaeon]